MLILTMHILVRMINLAPLDECPYLSGLGDAPEWRVLHTNKVQY